MQGDVVKLATSCRFTLPPDRSGTAYGFRRTDDVGYVYREEVVRIVLSRLTKKLGIPFNNRFLYLGVHEAGGKRGKILEKDHGHVHVLIRLPYRFTTPNFAPKLRRIMDDFAITIGVRREHGNKVEAEMNWLDFCFTLENKPDGAVLIQSAEAVATYISAKEYGLIDGRPFEKSPFGPAFRISRYQ